ncbi:ATP-grasp domain-containing protein, partial [Planctomycetota bacterium]
MKVHEYQAKVILKRFGVPVPEHRVAATAEEADSAANELGSPVVVLKAQVHAGGRGKGRFEGTDTGGVKVLKDRTLVREIADTMLGGKLVTHQTGAAGTICRKVLVETGLDIERELYLAVVLDRAVSKCVVMASAEGGVEIEEVAARTPEKILKEWVEPGQGLHPFQARRLAYKLSLPKEAVRGFVKVARCLVTAFEESDASLEVEVAVYGLQISD